MAYNFDERQSIVGTMTRLTTGSIDSTSVSRDGLQGSNNSVSHPWPYVVGAGWLMTKHTRHDALVSGSDGTWAYDRYLAFSAGDPPHPSVTPNKTVLNVLASTNPSRPIVDLPVAIAELRDLPKLFKIAGDTFLKKGASSYLNYEFGWKPFLSDLKGILDFQGIVDRRSNELTKLYERGGQSYTASGGSASNQSKPAAGVYKGSTIITQFVGHTDTWFSVSWKPDWPSSKRPPPVDEIRRRAFRSAFGLDLSISTVWEALPWSWLIDWFSDIGDFYMSGRNSVGFSPGQCFQMTHSESSSVYYIDGEHPRNAPGLTISGEATVHRTSKSRNVVSGGSATVFVPFLTGRQLGILGSLAILRQ